MNGQALSNDEFLAFMNYAKTNDPMPLTMPLTALILCGEGYANKYVDLVLPQQGKTRMYVADTFFKQLAKMLNLNIGISSRMEDEDFGIVLQAIKTLQSTHKSVSEITVVYDPTIKKLTHISAGGYNRVSNIQLFTFAEAIVSDRPDLKIVEVLGGQHSSDTEIRILSSEQIGLTDVTSDDPEEFQFGMTLANRGANTFIGDFAYRLVCANGMMSIRTDDRFKLGGTDADNLFKLFQHFEAMEKANYIPEDFNDNVTTASEVPASYGELLNAYNAIIKGIVPEFPEQRRAMEEAIKSMHFPELAVIEQKLAIRNIDVTELQAKQLQMLKSDKTMWELINILTDLGSNKSTFVLNNRNSLQRMGGKLLTKPFDLADLHLLMF